MDRRTDGQAEKALFHGNPDNVHLVILLISEFFGLSVFRSLPYANKEPHLGSRLSPQSN